MLVAGLTSVGGVFLLGVACFSFGEMLTGPKKSEYLGLISPPGKKGLYLGYVNIPVGIGGLIGAKLQGYVYGNFGEKAVLAQKYLAEHTDFTGGRGWDGDIAQLDAATGVPRTEAFLKLQEVTGLDAPPAKGDVVGVALGSRELERLVDEVRLAVAPFQQPELLRRIDAVQTAVRVLRAEAPRDEGRHQSDSNHLEHRASP